MNIVSNLRKHIAVGVSEVPHVTAGSEAIERVTRLQRQDEQIAERYASLGGVETLGNPVTKDLGELWTFGNGSCLCYDPDSAKVYHLYGEIYQKWVKLGGTNFGIPNTDEMGLADGVGRVNHFNKSTASIYWTPGTGAHEVHGDIHRKWFELGAEKSYLGYPKTDEVSFPDQNSDGRANEFQHGDIFWWPDTGAIDIGDVILHYTGFYCFKEAEADGLEGSDSPYIHFNISKNPHEQWTVHSKIYEDVNSGHSEPDLLELYRGRAYGLALGISLEEHDHGDVTEDRNKMKKAFKEAHDAGVKALVAIPYVGIFVAPIVDAMLGKVVTELGGVVFDLLGLSDDHIGNAQIPLSAKDMVTLAKGANSTSHGIGYRLESPMIKGMGAEYKVYFGIIPAPVL